MDAVELQINRENTAAFIAANPVVLTLTPRTKERTPAGGFKTIIGTPKDPQQLRIIETTGRTAPPQVKTQDGQLRDVAYWLLGPWDAKMQKGDTWPADDGTGRIWYVADVIRSNQYEVRGIVVEYGE